MAYVSPGNFESIGRYTVLSADAPGSFTAKSTFSFLPEQAQPALRTVQVQSISLNIDAS